MLTSGVRPTGCHVVSPPMSRSDTSAPAGVVVIETSMRDAGPHAVQHRIARNAGLRLRRQEKRFTVAVEVSEPEDLGQRHVARPARAARSPRPQRDDRRNHDDGGRQGADRPGPAPGHDAGRALRAPVPARTPRARGPTPRRSRTGGHGALSSARSTTRAMSSVTPATPVSGACGRSTIACSSS